MACCGSTPHSDLMQTLGRSRVFHTLTVSTFKALIHLSKFDARRRKGVQNTLATIYSGLCRKVASCPRPGPGWVSAIRAAIPCGALAGPTATARRYAMLLPNFTRYKVRKIERPE